MDVRIRTRTCTGRCAPPRFSFCVSVCDGAGGFPRAVDARRKRECVVGARYFADIRSIRTCHRFSSCFSGSLVLAGAAAAREAVAFSLPASPEVVAPGACMTGAGFWNVSPGLAIPVAIPVRYAFPWCVANTPLSPDPFMLVEVMSQARLRSLRMGRRGEDVQRVPKFRTPRRERKRARCRVRRGFTHLERKRSLHRRRCGQSAAVARGSMWSSPTRGRESYGTQTLLVLAHSCCTPSSVESLDSFFKTRRFITPQPQIPRFYDTTVAVRAVPISVHDIIKKNFRSEPTTSHGGSCLSNNPTGHFTTRAPARGAGVHRQSKAVQSTNMSVEEKAEARADGGAVVGEKKKRGSDDEAGDLAGEDRPATVRAKVDTSESDAALARALGGVPDADVEPSVSVAPNLGLSEVRTLPPASSRVPRPPLPLCSF